MSIWRLPAIRPRGIPALLREVWFDVEEVVVTPRQAGLIDHRVAKFARDEVAQLAHRRTAAGQVQLARLKAWRTLLLHGLQLMSVLTHIKNQCGQFFGVAVYRHLESFRQKGPQHLAQFPHLYLAGRFGKDIEPRVAHPIGADYLRILHAIRPTDRTIQPYRAHREA